MTSIIDEIRWDKADDGLAPVVVQDVETKDVLMLGFMNRAALEKTLESGHVTFWTRSRQKLWTKGETSGHVLKFISLRINCNNDSLLILAAPVGAICHTGHPTCYYREAAEKSGEQLRMRSSIRNKFIIPKRNLKSKQLFGLAGAASSAPAI